MKSSILNGTKKNMRLIICILLAVATFVVYSQVLDYDFISLDDPFYVKENLKIQEGFTPEAVSWAFSSSYIGVWAPITWLSFILDFQLYGLNPGGYHLTNLLFHIANAVILFLVLLRMTGAIWQSGLVAALFALHPFNVDSVAWIAERKNVLSTFFWFLTIWSYIFYLEKPGLKRYSLIGIVFILGLMSKSMLITLPFVLLLLDYWPLRRLKLRDTDETSFPEPKINPTSFSRLVLEKLPLFVPVIGSIIISVKVREGMLWSLDDFPMLERIINALLSYLLYLQKTFWPSGLAIFYAYPVNDLPIWKGLICGLILMGITIIGLRLLRKAPYFIVGWLWFLGTLVPVIGIVKAGNQAMADRYVYVPLIGIFIIIAWGLPDLMAKLRNKNKLFSAAAVVCIPILMTVTWNQVSHWKNTTTIYRHAIKVTEKEYPDFSIVHDSLATALFSDGKVEEAKSHYLHAIKLKPDNAQAYYNLGYVFYKEENFDEAVSYFKQTIKLDPAFAKAYNNLGSIWFSFGKTNEAISHYKKAIELKPDYTDAHYNLGDAYYKLGKKDEAISNYRKAIQLKGDQFKAFNNLGIVLFSQGKINEAIFNFVQAIQIKPDFAPAYDNLGSMLFSIGNTEEAIKNYKIAIQFQPDLAQAHNNLGNALFKQGKLDAAISHFRQAIQLQPALEQAHKNLKKALKRLEEDKQNRKVPVGTE